MEEKKKLNNLHKKLSAKGQITFADISNKFTKIIINNDALQVGHCNKSKATK